VKGGITMNFCNENDEYISLYIDGLLDDESSMELLKHIEECSECDGKLKDATYFKQLCREYKDMQLPEDFSSSLHRRLLEVGVKGSKSKFGLFVYNKKFIASLSTAAILVISLLAYNLFPQMGTKLSTASVANENAQVESSGLADSYSGKSEDKSKRIAGSADNSASSYNSQSRIQADSITTTGDVTMKFNQALTAENKKSIEPASEKSYNAPSNQQYFLNYAELNLKVTPGGIEIEHLRKSMNELGAIELKPVIINSRVGNPAESPVETLKETIEYVDYYLPLCLYGTLESQAVKYKLELSTKTNIVKNENTDLYNQLSTQKNENIKEIHKAQTNGGNTSVFEAEKTRLTEEMNKIITEKDMVTVRIFFVDR